MRISLRAMFVCSLVALLLFPGFAFAQQPERLTTVASVGASAGRHAEAVEEVAAMPAPIAKHRGLFSRMFHHHSKAETVSAPPAIDEHVRLVKNSVLYVARHCQKYMVDGKLDDGGAAICGNDASTIFYVNEVNNLRTTAGGDWQSSVMGNTAAPPATCNFIAVSNDATAPAAGDTAVASEIAANGLSRAQGVYAHTNGTSSFTVQKVFSATGTQASQKTGLLNAASAGTLCFENTYTQVTVNNGDTLTVTWTINI